jgi:hypothetical protein
VKVSEQLHAPASLPRGKSQDAYWIKGLGGPKAGQDGMEKRTFLTLSGLELRSFGLPACSQSLYRMLYNGYLQ